MARFTTRVQLDGYPKEEDYTKLHQAMKRKGFSRFIASTDGTTYRLPHAEYNLVADRTIKQVRDNAVAAAESVWNDIQVLVTEGTRSWHGLKEATTAEVAVG